MSSRIFWGAFAMLSFLLEAVIVYALFPQWKVYSQGKVVKVTIVQLPGLLSKYGDLKFEYEGKMHTISSGGDAALHVGDTLQMKYLESEDMFKFVDDNPLGAGVFCLVFFTGCGIYCIWYGFLRDRSP